MRVELVLFAAGFVLVWPGLLRFAPRGLAGMALGVSSDMRRSARFWDTAVLRGAASLALLG